MPGPSTSYRILLESLRDRSLTEKQLRNIADEKKLFFELGLSLPGALLQLQNPGVNFGHAGKWDNDPSPDRNLPAEIIFDKETQKYSITEHGLARLEQQTGVERRSG